MRRRIRRHDLVLPPHIRILAISKAQIFLVARYLFPNNLDNFLIRAGTITVILA